MLTTQLGWRLVPAYAAAYFLSYALRNVNAVLSPELTAEFALTDARLGLLTAAYFLSFGLFQLPLGVLLDRFGPRRVEQVLLLVAAAACAVFASARHWPELVLARAAMGLGLSACLMASFKSFTQWFAPDRLPALNATIMVAGGLGALSASAPVAWLLPGLGWRGVFWLFAGLLSVSAWAVSRTPDAPGAAAAATAPGRRVLMQIYCSRVFWCYAPQGMFVTGGMMAIAGLWQVPWLMSVEHYSRAQAAQTASLTALAMLAGFALVASRSGWLAQRGWSAMRLLRVGVGLCLFSQAALLLQCLPAPLGWALFGIAFSSTNIAYALLTRAFPAEYSGRVNTALNLAVFIGAFVLQWGLGAISQFLRASGLDASAALTHSAALVLGAQVLSYLWFLREAAQTQPTQRNQ